MTDEKIGRILVLSDSHGDLTTMFDIISHWEAKIDAIFFTGDGAEEFVEAAFMFEKLPFYAVTGNNDFNVAPNSRVRFPLEQNVEIAGHNIYLTHGHIAPYSGVKIEVLKRAKATNATIALYGHLHIPEVYIEDNIWRFNPGSIAYPRGNSQPSYLILKISDNYLEYDFFNAKSHQKIEDVF